MKKVFLSLAAIAVLTVVSCKKTETEEVVVEDSVDTTLVVSDDAAVMEVDSTVTVDTVAAPAAETPAAH